MTEHERRESLMVSIMNRLADRFGNHAVLKGGMALRLLDCPRATNDLDYVFIPYSSKKEIKDEVLDALRSIPGSTVTSSMNSKCLRCIVTLERESVQVEAQVDESCKSQETSTAGLARAHAQQGRIVRIMALDVALAHKIAAWLERELMRDLYDILFLWQVAGAKPDLDTLAQRLQRVERRVAGKSRKSRLSFVELAEALDAAASQVTDANVKEELRDYLGPEELAGLAQRFAIVMRRLGEWLRGVSPAA